MVSRDSVRRERGGKRALRTSVKGQIPFQMPVVATARWWHADVTCLDWDGAFALLAL